MDLPKLPVGALADRAVDWLTTHGAAAFDAVGDGVEAAVDGVLWALQARRRWR